MGRMIIDPGGGTAKGNADADYSNGALTGIGSEPPERLLASLMLVLRDKVNALRAAVLPVPLAAESIDDWITAWKAKLGILLLALLGGAA